MKNIWVDFSAGPKETDKTDETYNSAAVTNEEFLRVLFGSAPEDARPIIVSFHGDPLKAANSAWTGRTWTGGSPISLDANNYFSIAVFHPDDKGRFRRRKAQFAALLAIVLDDVGTKAPMDRLVLPPTWLLETSAGNYQAGYRLRAPLADGAMADRLMDAIIEAGLCDRGANGPQARLARLPQGSNEKHQPPFSCRMRAWNPERCYSVDELIAGFGLHIEAGKRKRAGRRSVDTRIPSGTAVTQPDGNIVLRRLREAGIYKRALGNGKHDISCPWVHEHTGAVDSGTAYFEPDTEYPGGGYKCLHGHCAGRHISNLLAHLGLTSDSVDTRPTIRVVAGEIHRVVDEAEKALAAGGEYYQRSGLIVTILTDPGSGEIRIQELSQPALVRALAQAAIWERFEERSEEPIRIDPPPRHVSVLFDASRYSHLPVLRGLTRQPYLRPDGSLLTNPGYDPDTGIFALFDDSEFAVPENPSRADAEASLSLLCDLLSEFSFSAPTDMGGSLSAFLTASVRQSLPTAPMFHNRAHMMGSGKSYLGELISTFATPQPGTPTAFPSTDDECSKVLLAELMRGPPVVVFDNLTTDIIAHKSLCTALTSEWLSGRILGLSRTATVATRTLILSSGNNVGPVRDMARRCITIHLSPQCEVPAARTFTRPDLIRDVLRERGRYVSAALCIIRAWIVAGRPLTPCRTVASYGMWSEYCRQPLLWLGYPDPATSIFEAMAEDPDREMLSRTLHLWLCIFGDDPAMVRDVVRVASGDNQVELLELLLDIAGERGIVNRRKLGWWLRRHAGRIVDGMRFERAPGKASAERWRVVKVTPVS